MPNAFGWAAHLLSKDQPWKGARGNQAIDVHLGPKVKDVDVERCDGGTLGDCRQPSDEDELDVGGRQLFQQGRQISGFGHWPNG